MVAHKKVYCSKSKLTKRIINSAVISYTATLSPDEISCLSIFIASCVLKLSHQTNSRHKIVLSKAFNYKHQQKLNKTQIFMGPTFYHIAIDRF